jgi:hypothetical protein
MRTFDIKNAAELAVPVTVSAMITATFASETWCEEKDKFNKGDTQRC